MLRYCRYKNFSEETITQIRDSAMSRISGVQVSDKDTIDEIWKKICVVELFESYADLSIELMGMSDSMWAVSYPIERSDCKPNIVTECEGDFEITVENGMKTFEPSLFCKKVKRIEPSIRRILGSKEMLMDIILNIYFSIDCWENRDVYCGLYDDLSFGDMWRAYCKKGRDKNGRSRITFEEDGKKDFNEVTNNNLPVSCKIKIKSNQGPEVQYAIGNVFRVFVKNPKLVDIYELGKEEKYKKIKKIHTMYKYNISEKYVWEEILGSNLSYEFTILLKKNYPDITTNVIRTKAEENICILLKNLLKWEGQNTRVLIVRSLEQISSDEIKEKLIKIEKQAEIKENYINSMINKYSEYVEIINNIGTECYQNLYDDIFYILLARSENNLEDVGAVCEEYLNKYLSSKDSKKTSEIRESDLYYLIQKWVLGSIKEVRMSI